MRHGGKYGSILDQHARQSKLLLAQKFRRNEQLIDDPDPQSHIRGRAGPQTLPNDNAQGG